MSTTTSVDTGGVVTFTANGEYLVGGSHGDVGVWRVKDGKQIATMEVESSLRSIATSKDGRYIAVGTHGQLSVWDATTYKQVFAEMKSHEKYGPSPIWGADFSPDSTQVVFADCYNGTAMIFDVTGREARKLCHDDWVYAAKYSPHGDRIATATGKNIRIWDSNNGQLLVDLKEPVAQRCFLWHDDYLFVKTTGGKFKQIDASGSTVAEWPAASETISYITLPHHGRVIAYCVKNSITFLTTSTHFHLDLVPHTEDIVSIMFSPNGQLLAITDKRKTTIRAISSGMFRLFSIPDTHIESATLELWKHGQLTDAESLLISTSQNRAHVLASRALIRARLRQWDAALIDAGESIKFQRSLVGYIAESVALVGKGERNKAIRVCDSAFQHFHSGDQVTLLLLIKAVVLFMAGEHEDAMLRLDDLIASADPWVDPPLHAYMHLLLGNLQMENRNFEGAIQSFEDARIKLGNHTQSPPLIISLLSGWKFDHLAVTIQCRLCEVLLTTGCIKVAGESVLRMADQQIHLAEPMNAWVSDHVQQCCPPPGSNGNSSQVAAPDTRASMPKKKLCASQSTPLLREWARLRLTIGSWRDALVAAASFILPKAIIYQVICEHLEMSDHLVDAVACFHQMSSELAQIIDSNWSRDFMSRCSSKLENFGENSMNAKQYDEAILQYTAALSLNLTSPRDLLVRRSNAFVGVDMQEDAVNDAKEWARLMLSVTGSWGDALAAATSFTLPRLTMYRVMSEHLEMTDRIADAVACFHQMSSELEQETIDGGQGNWIRDFISRCSRKLEKLGDNLMGAQKYDEAISQYTAAVSLNPTSPQDFLVKRSRALAEQGKWEDALNDADRVISLNPSSPSGYERRHAALLGTGRHDDAIDALGTMLSKMSESSDLDIRERSRHFVWPEQTKEAIHASIRNAIRDSPLVLINTVSGRLCSKAEQAAAFESAPAYAKLIASMTTRIDHALINQVVGEFYRYATLSHTWLADEPLYERVIRIVVYNLGPSLTHDKLRTFCTIIREEGLNWAWSDTCCINKADYFVLQEALVNMFKWYEGSAMTLIFLFDVDQLAEPGALMLSIWNSRGWTLQEYHASKVVRIYTKDWTPYLGLTTYNHKESPEIISEMEKAIGISASALKAIRPGLTDIREKLRLASTRQTTRIEDAAYSLLGIFSMSMSVTYGEGKQALGRLLSQLLTSSGDTSILAWSGAPSEFNSSLPTSLTVFSQPPASHFPPVITNAETETVTTGLHTSPLDLVLVTRLLDQLNVLPTPFFVVQRMKLPCLAFRITGVSLVRKGSEVMFHAHAPALGAVEIKTRINLTKAKDLYLVYPWIDFLLDRHATRNRLEMIPEEIVPSELDEGLTLDALPELSSTSTEDPLDSTPLPSPLPLDTQVVYPFLARLRQPFGALLLKPGRRNTEYKRILAESVITAQVEEITSVTLDALIQSVRVLDVL